ncbi:hypothetical protein [Microcoleus vaginatus]|uniref:hypothetical protein n=1 Tax=Microcoleus vaginatus TaxID=119532 RepID=UPI0032A580D4
MGDRAASRSHFSRRPGVDRTHIQYFRFALPMGFVQRLSESGNFSRWARLYKFAIALLIYQQSDENPANARAGNKSSDRF